VLTFSGRFVESVVEFSEKLKLIIEVQKMVESASPRRLL
jgi:hypothetical protein